MEGACIPNQKQKEIAMENFWRVVSRESGKFARFNIELQTVQHDDGTFSPYSFVNMFQGVCILPLLDEETVLCLEQYRPSFNAWLLELPAGMLDKGNEPEIQARQELEEETGFRAQEMLSLGKFYPSPGATNETIFLFAAKNLTQTQQCLESSERIKVRRMPLKTLIIEWENGEFLHGAGIAALGKYMHMQNNSAFSIVGTVY